MTILKTVLILIPLLIILPSCAKPLTLTETKFVLIYPNDLLLEECEITPPPSIEWGDPDQAVKGLTRYSVMLLHDNKTCSRKIEAIRNERDLQRKLYQTE